jgi:hypothetical protein
MDEENRRLTALEAYTAGPDIARTPSGWCRKPGPGSNRREPLTKTPSLRRFCK